MTNSGSNIPPCHTPHARLLKFCNSSLTGFYVHVWSGFGRPCVIVRAFKCAYESMSMHKCFALLGLGRNLYVFT